METQTQAPRVEFKALAARGQGAPSDYVRHDPALGSSSLLENSVVCHSEEPKATKNLCICLIQKYRDASLRSA
jgi:hypothetical protein